MSQSSDEWYGLCNLIQQDAIEWKGLDPSKHVLIKCNFFITSYFEWILIETTSSTLLKGQVLKRFHTHTLYYPLNAPSSKHSYFEWKHHDLRTILTWIELIRSSLDLKLKANFIKFCKFLLFTKTHFMIAGSLIKCIVSS